MLIVYDSRTGNVRRFVARLDRRAIPVAEAGELQEPFVLVTYTTGFGQVPDSTARFLLQNGHRLAGVAASGNRNWGDGFAKAADRVGAQYRVPVLGRFELSGTSKEAAQFLQELDQLAVAADVPGVQRNKA
ncbi:MAG: NrdI protein [Paenibacillaceae bacterium]|jgi:protein involved in ribonucleotide reduction|nr:NrdI protein [Paenibacillaceae bacterium]